MNVSLLEMVLAIALTGMIFAAAILPTTETLVDYRAAEINLQNLSAHGTAAVRFDQVARSIWRDASGPLGSATIQNAQSGWLQVGYWELLLSAGHLQQRYQSRQLADLVPAVSTFSFAYLLNTGVWTNSPTVAQRDQVVALRCNWVDPASQVPFGGVAVAPDRRFSGGLLLLPKPDTSTAYSRSNYTRSLNFSLGAWP